MTLADIRSRLAGLEGRTYWRSLEELADTPEFREYVGREFPAQASEFSDPAGRRDFLKLMGASLALAGVSACTRQPRRSIVPYVRQPEEVIPGRPLFYATAMPLGGFGYPLLAENHMGRPTKLEGNPDHPASLGATEHVRPGLGPRRCTIRIARARSSSAAKSRRGARSLPRCSRSSRRSRRIKGATFRLLTEPVTSPSLTAQIQTLLAALPEARWHQWDAVYGASQDGAPAAHAIYQLDKADVVVALDADFLGFGPAAVRHTKDFSSRRRMGTPQDALNRLYVVEPVPTVTGSNADHRLSLKSRDVHAFAAAVAAAVGRDHQRRSRPRRARCRPKRRQWAAAVAADLTAHKGRSVVIAGERQPAVVHAIARAINDALGNTGRRRCIYTAPIAASPADGSASLAALVDEMNAGKVDALVILGGNPVFTAPADLKFGEALAKVANRVHLGLYYDETAEQCHWHVQKPTTSSPGATCARSTARRR